MIKISEQDWKIFRKKIPDWQKHYMERLEAEYMTLLSGDKEASSKFWELEERIKRDKKSPGVVIDMRRSTAIENMVQLLWDDVISPDDLKEFSDDLQEIVNFIARRR